MNKKFKKIITVIMMLIILSVCTYSFADVGSFDRYDSGSSSWGGSSGWSSSSSSSDWGDDYSYSGSGTGDIGFILGFLIGNDGGKAFLIILIILYFVYRNKIKGQMQNRPSPTYTAPRPTVDTTNINKGRSQEVAKQIMAIDPLFSEEKFTTYTKELFVKLQNAWTARDWEPMRLFETPELFEQHKNQVQGYIDTNRINVMDRIAVNYSYLYNYRQDGDKEILEVALKSTMKDYIIDASTKELLEGSKTEDRHTIYKLTFERKKGNITSEDEEMKTTNCPNCGAPTKITSTGKCEYCGSIIMIGDHGWVLSNLEPFRN